MLQVPLKLARKTLNGLGTPTHLQIPFFHFFSVHGGNRFDKPLRGHRSFDSFFKTVETEVFGNALAWTRP